MPGIDERPGEVLHASESFVGELSLALLHVGPELDELGIEL